MPENTSQPQMQPHEAAAPAASSVWGPRLWRLILIDLVIMIALCLGVRSGMHYMVVMKRTMESSSDEVRNAPHICVDAGYSIHNYVRVESKIGPLGDAPLGRSIWWDSDWQKLIDMRHDEGNIYLYSTDDKSLGKLRAKDSLEPFAPRERARDVTGAVRFLPGQRMKVSAYLRPGADGVWKVSRVEACGSSEDMPREGEVCLPAELDALTWAYDVYAEQRQGKNVPCPKMTLHIGNGDDRDGCVLTRYRLSIRELASIRRLRHCLTFRMELALLPGRAPVPVELYINGHPLADAMRYLHHGQIPPVK